jgi:sec-independent protein translocase protein TatA
VRANFLKEYIMIGNLGTSELIIILVIVFIIFGAKRIPEIGKGLGGAIREFKNIGKEIRRPASKADSKKKLLEEKNEESPSLEAQVAKKVAEKVPAVKKVMDMKDKVDKVADILK